MIGKELGDAVGRIAGVINLATEARTSPGEASYALRQ